MKRTLLIMLCFVQFGYAQKENSIYVSGSLELGNYVGVDLGVTYVVNNKYSFSFGWLGELHDIENYPVDIYSDPLFFEEPDHSSNYYFSFGRLIEFKNSENNRLNLSIGVAKTVGTRHYNYVRGDFAYNDPIRYHYTKSTEKYIIYSIIVNPKVEFIPTSVFGWYVSPKVVFNEKRIYYGVGIGLMLGKLR